MCIAAMITPGMQNTDGPPAQDLRTPACPSSRQALARGGSVAFRCPPQCVIARFGTLAAILLLERNKRLPGILIAVVGATAVVGALDLGTRQGVTVLGPLPQGLPGFAIPLIGYDDIIPVLIGGCAAALVSFADTSVLSRAYAARLGDRADPNQEMVGLGAANLVAGFFQGFPISSSGSRTPVAEAAGARTQLTSVVGALPVIPFPSPAA